MVHRLKVGDGDKAFELSHENCLDAETRFGIKLYTDDFIPPFSLATSAKFAVVGFHAEDKNVSKVEAIDWMRGCDPNQFGDAVADGFKVLHDMDGTKKETDGESLSTGTNSDTSDSES
jgi:hypothetical protein